MSIMSIRLFLVSALLATAIAQSIPRRARGRGRGRWGNRPWTLRPTGGFYPTGTGGFPTGTGGFPTGSGGLFPTSVVVPVDPTPSTTVVTTTTTEDEPTTVVTTDITATEDQPTDVPTAVSTTEDSAPQPTSDEPETESTTDASAPVTTTVSPVAVPATTPTPAPAPPTGALTSKKGLSFTNPTQLTSWVGKNVGWTYNWWITRGNVPADMEYYPMMHCPTKLSLSGWTSAANTAISQGSKRLLGFNEPDQVGQCDITPEAAAAGHQTYMNPFSGKALIGGPAVTNGPAPMGLAYQEKFFEACAGNCQIDFMTAHWYGGKQNALYNFQLQVNRTYSLGVDNNITAPVFVTEFGMTDGTPADKAAFITAATEWMDSDDKVGGYSYFMASDGILNQGDAISPVLGKAYADA